MESFIHGAKGTLADLVHSLFFKLLDLVSATSKRCHSSGSIATTSDVLCPGQSDSQSRNMPTLVKDISGVGQVACGSSHTIAVAQDGRTVWSFGGGDNGEWMVYCSILTQLV